MRTRLYDRQNTADPTDGTLVESADQLRALLERFSTRPPFFLELIGDNGYKLLLGLGPDQCCAQFSAVDGSPPYLMAVASDAEVREGDVEFLMGDTPSPVPMRYCLPRPALVEIAAEFIQSGGRKSTVTWEEI
jgi:hypothetical protein